MPRGSRFSTTPTSLSTPTSTEPPATFNDSLPLPKMIVFDLDYTLWPFWVDTHISGPLKASSSGSGVVVKDRYGESCGFYVDVPSVLRSIKDEGIVLGAASRTSAPGLARELLGLLRIPASTDGGSSKAISLFDHMEIYPGSKMRHFRQLKEKSGVDFGEMLFFDDESRNREVEELGVTMWLVRDGVSRGEIDKGVEEWRRRRGRNANGRGGEDE